MATITAVGQLIFSFLCHHNIFAVKKDLKNTSLKKMNKAILRAVLIEMVCYLLIAIGGYYGLCKYTPPIITNRPALPG